MLSGCRISSGADRGIESSSLAYFVPGNSALVDLDAAAKEWIGLIAYRLMGKTDALFPGP